MGTGTADDDKPATGTNDPPETGTDKPATGNPESSPPDLAAMEASLRKANHEARTWRKKVQELEDAGKSELEKLSDRASTAEQRAADAEAKALRLEIATRKGLPEALAYRLQGSTESELAADADVLLKLVSKNGDREGAPPPPKPDPDQGKGGGNPDGARDGELNTWFRRASGISAS